MNYAQPKEYHFCLDSVLFPKLVADLVRDTLPPQAQVMDLGAGCGVLGYEFLFHRNDVARMVFLEKQKIFAEYLHENEKRLRATLSLATQFEFQIQDLKEQQPQDSGAYDLILVNPPYYFENEGLVPPEVTKANCHFFLESTPSDFLKAMEFLLKPSGEAYVLVKKPERWPSSPNFISVGEVRGTSVMKFKNELQ